MSEAKKKKQKITTQGDGHIPAPPEDGPIASPQGDGHIPAPPKDGFTTKGDGHIPAPPTNGA
ncbi:sigma-like protein [Streptomyces aurantiacus]|uniref:Sigma-like protein n=1 Tax=Streptomyces aurantiacus JA 4570 TaxID=1286094 RepID=S3ZLB0_9ACTN|nr:hypothetical protein [Streptomyces aurantiacus]EPH44033.1 hypothetical protein STRAU_2896 [Streptomyces aurantiacus JA 4570]